MNQHEKNHRPFPSAYKEGFTQKLRSWRLDEQEVEDDFEEVKSGFAVTGIHEAELDCRTCARDHK